MDSNKTKIRNSEKEKLGQKVNKIFARHFRWLIFVFCIFIIFSGFIFLIKPKYTEVSGLTDTSQQEKEQELIAKKKELRNLEDLKEAYSVIDPEDIKRVEAMLPNKYIYEELFSRFENIVLRNNLMLESLKIKADGYGSVDTGNVGARKKIKSGEEETLKLPVGVKKVSVSLNIIGVDYLGLKGLLKTFEDNLRLMDVTKVVLRQDNGIAELEVDTYYLDN